MVSTPYSLTDNWTDANRYTAASDSEMLLSNPSAQDLRWARAADETAPGVAPSRAHLLRPGRSQSIPLTMGETLWMAGAPGGHAVIDIFAPLPGTVITGEPALQSRGELVTLVSDGNGPDAGAEIMAGGQTYLAAAGATAIADLPGLVPSREVTLEHFGAVGDGVTDDTAAWDAANDYLESLGGGVIQGALGKTYALLDTTIASNVTFRGHGPRRGGLCAHANIAQGQGWLTNRDLNTDDETRTCYNVAILDCDLDGSNMPFDRWLTQADGTPITDPEADYVMGTGALASGISGVDLTAVVTDGAVTSVTVNNGGTGWNSHPTHPYQPSTVAIRFEGGGGAGAVATATISGGTIVSVDVDKGGIGYTSAPSATTMGGYADISLLVDPSVDRRNPNYDILGFGVTLRKVVAPRVENVRFLNFKSGGLSDAGCLNGAYRDLTFEGCGKNDGPYHCVWVQSYTSPTADPISAAFADSENTLLEDIYIDGAGRSAVAWGPTKGGTIRRLTARNTGESTLWVSDVLHQNGGRSVFDQLDLRDNILTDIAAAHIEAGNNSNILIKNSRFEGGCELAIELAGCRNIKVIDCEFIDNGTALSQLPGRTPFGPFSERYAYNVGNYPVAGSELIRQEMDVIKVGTVSGVGSDQVVIRNCLFSESRSAYPPQLLNRIKFGGGNFLAGSLVFEGNDLTGLPDDMVLMYGQGNVFDANIPVTIRDNLGHASEGPVVLTQTVGNTNTKFLRPGFRPSRIEAVALSVSGAGSDGQLNWVSSGAHVAFCTARPTGASPMSVDGALVETRSADGSTVTCRIELKDWEVDGVNLTVTTNTENVDVRFVCYP